MHRIALTVFAITMLAITACSDSTPSTKSATKKPMQSTAPVAEPVAPAVTRVPDAGPEDAEGSKEPTATWTSVAIRIQSLPKMLAASTDKASDYSTWMQDIETSLVYLRDEGSIEELELLPEGEFAPMFRFIRGEGMLYAAEVSPGWLRKNLTGLPAAEMAYLRWTENHDVHDWFAEGELQVEVSVMKDYYKTGVRLLATNGSWFRKGMIEDRLDQVALHWVTLLSADLLPYSRKKFIKQMKESFSAMKGYGPHATLATKALTQFPLRGFPHPTERVYDFIEDNMQKDED